MKNLINCLLVALLFVLHCLVCIEANTFATSILTLFQVIKLQLLYRKDHASQENLEGVAGTDKKVGMRKLFRNNFENNREGVELENNWERLQKKMAD